MSKGNSKLNITDVRIRLVEIEGKKTRAIASITIDDCFVVNELKVIDGSKGLFVAMPGMKSKDNTLRDIAHPINQETRDHVTAVVLEKYEQAVSEAAATEAGAAESTGAVEATADAPAATE